MYELTYTQTVNRGRHDERVNYVTLGYEADKAKAEAWLAAALKGGDEGACISLVGEDE